MRGIIVAVCFMFIFFKLICSNDYKTGCVNTFNSFWYFGSCYVFVGAKQNWSQAMSTCNILNMSLATVYSEQQAVALYNYIIPKMSNVSTSQIWIGAQNTPTGYQFFKNNTLTYGFPVTQYPVGNEHTFWNVDSEGTCVYMQNDTDESVHFYNGSCSALKSYICQYYPKFFLRPCGYALQDAPGIVNLTVSANTPSLCTQYCANEAWCAGANYNAITQQCQLCTVNTFNDLNVLNITLAPKQCWTFYERESCDVPGTWTDHCSIYS